MESIVANALKRYYTEKYKDLQESQRKIKIEEAIANTIPSSTKSIAPRSKMLYGPSKSEERDSEQRINKSGFTIVYDSFTEGLEPIYFWLLDFMRDTFWGSRLDVKKIEDDFEAAIGGGFFGDIGTRMSVMQDRATKLMATINTVVRSVINIIYDLKEFDQRLYIYEQLKSTNKEESHAAKLGLKQIWMDRVDIQKGRGSINMLTQQLQFITLRDAFMAANSLDDIKKMDLNDRVKRILEARLSEYLKWEELSEQELRRRHEIERVYLKSQISSLHLYTQWARPYLKAAQQLRMMSSKNLSFKTADVVNLFNNLEMRISLFGKKGVSPADANKKFSNIKLPKGYYACVEIGFKYRTSPQTIKSTQTGTHYTQGGRIEVNFRAFGLNQDEIDAVEKEETIEGLELIEELTNQSLGILKEELDKYIKGEKEPEDPIEKLKFFKRLLDTEKDPEEKKKLTKKITDLEKQIRKKLSPSPFKALFESFKNSPIPLPKIFGKTPSLGYIDKATREAAKSSAASTLYIIYNVYKKVHRMFTE